MNFRKLAFIVTLASVCLTSFGMNKKNDIPKNQQVMTLPKIEPVVYQKKPVVQAETVMKLPVIEPVVYQKKPVFQAETVMKLPVIEPVMLEKRPVLEPVMLEKRPVLEPVMLEKRPVLEPVMMMKLPVLEAYVADMILSVDFSLNSANAKAEIYLERSGKNQVGKLNFCIKFDTFNGPITLDHLKALANIVPGLGGKIKDQNYQDLISSINSITSGTNNSACIEDDGYTAKELQAIDDLSRPAAKRYTYSSSAKKFEAGKLI